MSGNRLLLDSNICIYLSQKALIASDIISPADFVAISIITYMETLGFDFKEDFEENYLINFFAKLSILPINGAIANRVIAYRKKKKIKLPDAILLATAREYNCKLVTRNTTDFNDLDDQVEMVNPFDK
jgi:hypothetical protein